MENEEKPLEENFKLLIALKKKKKYRIVMN